MHLDSQCMMLLYLQSRSLVLLSVIISVIVFAFKNGNRGVQSEIRIE